VEKGAKKWRGIGREKGPMLALGNLDSRKEFPLAFSQNDRYPNFKEIVFREVKKSEKKCE